MSSASSPLWPAAEAAANMVEPGMVVGLGTGRAAAMFLRALAVRVADGLDVRGVPTSRATTELARQLAVPLAGLDEVERLDIDVDGADEVDPALDLIKGHGGALLRERVVASISKKFVILVGEQKMVPRLGTRVSVPVEVVPFAVPVVKRRLEKELEGTVRLRLDGAGGVFVSDNGNHILDAAIERIEEPSAIVRRIDGIPGVVDNGLFIGMADLVLVQSETGFRRLSRA